MIRQTASFIQLLLGDYNSGLKNYEWRLKEREAKGCHASPIIKKWDEEEINLKEQLMVISEQGLGDTIQFIRYIKKLFSQV